MKANRHTDFEYNDKPSLDVAELQNFLERVAHNNSREWLAANRAEYDRLRGQWFQSIDCVCHCMSSWLPGMAAQTGRSSSYRFYRDTRFSPDKSPLKTYFSAAFSPVGRHGADHRAGYYMQIGTAGSDDNGLWGGIYYPDSAQLAKLRRAIVDNIDEFTSIITEPRFVALYPHWTGERLTTAPKGWPRDHRDIELLRLKEYGRQCTLSAGFFTSPDWSRQVSDRFRVIKPLVDFINYSLDE